MYFYTFEKCNCYTFKKCIITHLFYRCTCDVTGFQEKKRAFSIHGKPVTSVDGNGRAFLSVAPALPVLQGGTGASSSPAPGPGPGTSSTRAPRLARRSHSSVGGPAGGGAPVAGDIPEDGDLQSMHDGRLQVARTTKEKEKNPDRISLDRWVQAAG